MGLTRHVAQRTMAYAVDGRETASSLKHKSKKQRSAAAPVSAAMRASRERATRMAGADPGEGCDESSFADLLAFLRQPDTQVSNALIIWFLPSPPRSLLSPCQRGLRAVATHCGVVQRRVRGRSMRHRPLHTLPSAYLPRTTRLSQNPPPTVNTRPRRTRGKGRRRSLWAARRMKRC